MCRDITYYPDQSWAIYIPTALLCAFFSAPLIYAVINVVSTPKLDSIDTIWDDHSRVATGIDGRTLMMDCDGNDENSTIPSICDIDVGVINRYFDGRAIVSNRPEE